MLNMYFAGTLWRDGAAVYIDVDRERMDRTAVVERRLLNFKQVIFYENGRCCKDAKTPAFHIFF